MKKMKKKKKKNLNEFIVVQKKSTYFTRVNVHLGILYGWK